MMATLGTFSYRAAEGIIKYHKHGVPLYNHYLDHLFSFCLGRAVVYSFVKIYTLSNWTKKFTNAHSKNITNKKCIRGVIG
ncbi:hypothetical protein QFZ31_000559 [Neobacillus niacini]|nr:hypothetical protein [Neobacillus niacini]